MDANETNEMDASLESVEEEKIEEGPGHLEAMMSSAEVFTTTGTKPGPEGPVG